MMAHKIGLSLRIGMGVKDPQFYAGNAADFDFVQRRYWWAGTAHGLGDMTTPTGSAFGAGATDGLVPTSSTNLTLLWSALGLSAPFSFAVVYVPTSVPAANRTALLLRTDGNNFINVVQSTAQTNIFTAFTGGVTQASFTDAFTVNAKTAFAASIDTNSIIGSINGGAATGSPDTVATPSAIGTIYFARAAAANLELLGALRRVVFFTGSKTQNELNALTADLLAAA